MSNNPDYFKTFHKATMIQTVEIQEQESIGTE
jgi:hypothetical protein